MFTGIIEEIGTVGKFERRPCGAFISVECGKILSDLNIGDSVAVNGACQTVISKISSGFEVESSQETLDLTNFEELKEGDKVNLERAMSANGRFGGHFVSGHIDGTGIFLRRQNTGVADVYYFEAPESISKYIIVKGSICINGISLTIASLNDNIFSISVIPQTSSSTNLGLLRQGQSVNLESDMMARYI